MRRFLRRQCRVIRVEGPQAHELLNVLLTQQLDDLSFPAAREWLWLEAKGAIVAAGSLLLPDDATALLWVDQCLADPVVDRLNRFKFSLKAAISLAAELTVVSEPTPDTSVKDQYPLVSQDAFGWVITYPYGWADRLLTLAMDTDPSVNHEGDSLEGSLDVITGNGQDRETVRLSEGWEEMRINAGVPVWGREIVPGTRAQELGLLPTHGHMNKGCYPGQESIAKIYNLGEVRRKLCLLETPEPVSVGDLLTQRREAAITSATATRALAMVSLNNGELPADIGCGNQLLRVVEAVGSRWEIPAGWRNKPEHA